MIELQDGKIRFVNGKGESFLLSEVDGTDLKHAIEIQLNMLEEAKKVLDGAPKSAFDEALTGRKQDTREAKKFVQTHELQLAPYILEALVRGVDVKNYIKMYQGIIGRKTGLEASTSFFGEKRAVRLIDSDIPFE